MTTDNSLYIEQLLSRYMAGESTTDEEQFLREYFSSDDIATNLAGYRDMFLAIDGITPPSNLEMKINDMINDITSASRCHTPPFYLHKWLRLAACIAVIFTIVFYGIRPMECDEENQMTSSEVAYHTTMALRVLSRTINAMGLNIDNNSNLEQ